MSESIILKVYSTGDIAPHNTSSAKLLDKITNPDDTAFLIAFEISEEQANQTSTPLSEQIEAARPDKILDALKVGFSAAARALVSPPIDFAEAERKLMAWLKGSLPSVAKTLERKPTLLMLAEQISGVAFDLTEGCDYEDDKGKDVSDETRKQRIDTLATLWLLRRAKEREEAKRHAALILDAVTTAANTEVAT